MSVEIKFNSSSHGDVRYEDGEGREYRYLVKEGGTLAILEMEDDGVLTKDSEPIAVYGAAAWFSVTGDALRASDGSLDRVLRAAVS
ncbi:hypothetical protein ACFV0C_37040 [Streptomyces sp. NPDC059568]|uniref:hypothetical protein n=1 Tax=Streptomyces sp. NPDC059568 TaxID=3346868 RepID=UPI0036917629